MPKIVDKQGKRERILNADLVPLEKIRSLATTVLEKILNNEKLPDPDDVRIAFGWEWVELYRYKQICQYGKKN